MFFTINLTVVFYAGPDTNGSQFFITTVKTPWLDVRMHIFFPQFNGTHVLCSIVSVIYIIHLYSTNMFVLTVLGKTCRVWKGMRENAALLLDVRVENFAHLHR